MSGTDSRFRAWYIVAILVVLYATSFVDRLILALLVQPVSAEFHLTDTIQGIMLGAGFSIMYAISGPVLAHFLDRSQRIRIVAAGAMLWGATTVASGFAQNLAMLLICRSGVAIGEAVLVPAAISLIADLFPSGRRTLPVSIFVGVSQLMGVGAHAVGGLALEAAGALSPLVHMAPWRLTLCIAGAPSILVALLMLATVREPARIGDAESGASGTLREFMRHLHGSWTFYGPIFLAFGTGSMMFYGLAAWLPTLIVRSFGYSAAHAGSVLGAIGAIAGLCGVFFWPWFAKQIGKRSPVRGLIVCLLVAAAINATAIIVATRQFDIVWFLAGFCVAIMANAAQPPIMSILIQTLAPGRMHARLISIPTLLTSLIGFTLGPFLIPLFAQLWPNEPGALAFGIALLVACTAPIVLLLYSLSLLATRTKSVEQERAAS